MDSRLVLVVVTLSVFVLEGVVLGGMRPAIAQSDARPDSAVVDSTRSWQDDAWTPIVSHDGVEVRYIFYSEADNANNGVVLRLHNRNAVAVRYHFTVIFRTPADERTAEVDGVLEPGEMKTGESDGLFWIPFPDGQSIGEIGLRGLEVETAEGEL